MSKKEVKFMITAFRDGIQSIYGSRVLSKDFMPVVEACVNSGIKYFESGGGATFQSAFLYNKENAFDVMDSFRNTVGKDVDLQTLSHSVSIVCLETQPSEIIKMHAELFKKHGITTIRNFDAFNNINNLIHSGKFIKETGVHHQVCITMMSNYTGCEVLYNADYYLKVLKDIINNVEYDSICFKDTFGITSPQVMYETIKAARKLLGKSVRIQVHSHDTAGRGVLQYKSALEAGCDYIDLSLAPVSGGICQTDLITMWYALRGTDYYLDININEIVEIEALFQDCMNNYFFPTESKIAESMISLIPMPGDELINNIHIMKDINLMNKFPDLIKAMIDAIKHGGFGVSVTPISQFYFQQAFNNVIQGYWKDMDEGYSKMVLGYFGKTPCVPDAEIIRMASEKLKLESTVECPIYIDDKDSKKGINASRDRLKSAGIFDLSDENIFISAIFKEKGIQFLKGESQFCVRKNIVDNIKYIEDVKYNMKNYESLNILDKIDKNELCVNIGNNSYNIKINDDKKAVVNGVIYNYNIVDCYVEKELYSKNITNNLPKSIVSGLPGIVLKIETSVGKQVFSGSTIVVLETMKLEVDINSSVSGIVQDIKVKVGDSVLAGQEIAVIS